MNEAGERTLYSTLFPNPNLFWLPDNEGVAKPPIRQPQSSLLSDKAMYLPPNRTKVLEPEKTKKAIKKSSQQPTSQIIAQKLKKESKNLPQKGKTRANHLKEVDIRFSLQRTALMVKRFLEEHDSTTTPNIYNYIL